MRTQQQNRGNRPIPTTTLATGVLTKCTYLSSDELERFDAFQMGVENVFQHDSEVGNLGSDDILIVDFHNQLWDDKAAAIDLAIRSAKDGTIVSIHTYNPDHPLLEQIGNLPNVVVAKTHRAVRAELIRQASAG